MIGTNNYEIITHDLYDDISGVTGSEFRNTPDMGGIVLFPLPVKNRGNVYYQTISIGVSFAVGIIKQVNKTIAINVTVTPAIQKLIQKIISIDVILTPQLQRVIQKIISISSPEFSVSVQKQINKTFSIDNPYTVTVTRAATFTQIIDIVVTNTVNVVKLVQKTINIPATFDVGIQKNIYKTISIGVSFAVTVLEQFVKLVAINVGSVFTVEVTVNYIPYTTIFANVRKFIGNLEKWFTGFNMIGKL